MKFNCVSQLVYVRLRLHEEEVLKELESSKEARWVLDLHFRAL